MIIFILPPGGFFVFGMLVALANKISGKKPPETVGCGACPLKDTCSKVSGCEVEKEGEKK